MVKKCFTVKVAIPETIEKNSQYGVGPSKIESAGDCESHKHITWVSGFDFERSLGYENSIRQMGAAFAHNRPYTQSCDNFDRMFGVFQPQ